MEWLNVHTYNLPELAVKHLLHVPLVALVVGGKVLAVDAAVHCLLLPLTIEGTVSVFEGCVCV